VHFGTFVQKLDQRRQEIMIDGMQVEAPLQADRSVFSYGLYFLGAAKSRTFFGDLEMF
jgi:hypothetical protein